MRRARRWLGVNLVEVGGVSQPNMSRAHTHLTIKILKFF